MKWAAGGIVVCDAVHSQHDPVVIGDGAGNAFVAWVDYRGWAEERIDEDIFAQKIDRDGNPRWTTNGVAVCADQYRKRNPQLALDGAGGVYVAWEVYRDGNTLYSSQWDPHLAAVDGGVVIAWTDFRNVDDGLGRDLFADFVSASGVRR